MRAGALALILIASCLGAAEDTAPIPVATKHAPPFVMVADDGSISGITIDLIETVAAAAGREVAWRPMELEEMLDAVAAGEVAAAAAAITVSAEREARMDFSYPYFITGLGIAVGGERRSRWLALLGQIISFDFLKVLAGLTGVLLLSGFVLWLFERKRNPQFGGRTVEGIGASMWWSAVTMTTVGYGDKAPITLGGRLVALWWMFASIIIISSFTAAIATSLTLEGMTLAVRSEDDLAQAKSAVVEGTIAQAELQSRHHAHVAVADLGEAFDLLRAGRVDAVIHDRPLLRYALKDDDSGLQALDVLFRKQGYALALPHGSELREALNQRLLELLSDGTMAEITARYLE